MHYRQLFGRLQLASIGCSSTLVLLSGGKPATFATPYSMVGAPFSQQWLVCWCVPGQTVSSSLFSDILARKILFSHKSQSLYRNLVFVNFVRKWMNFLTYFMCQIFKIHMFLTSWSNWIKNMTIEVIDIERIFALFIKAYNDVGQLLSIVIIKWITY